MFLLKEIIKSAFLGYVVGLIIAKINLFGTSHNAEIYCMFGAIAYTLIVNKVLNKTKS